MANIYDTIGDDPTSGNIYDKIPTTVTAAPTKSTPQKKRDYKLFEVPGAALKNAIPDTVQGIQDFGRMITHLPETVGAIGDAVSHPLRTSKAVAGVVGDALFNDPYGNLKRTLAEHPVTTAANVAGALTGVGGVAGGVAKGAELAGAASVASKAAEVAKALHKAGSVIDPLTAAGKLPGVSHIGNAMNKVGTHVAKGAWDAFSPEARLWNEVTEGKLRETSNALNNAKEIIPGSKLNAAEAATQAGLNLPKLSKLAKVAGDILPSTKNARKAEVAAAQLNHLDFAGTPDEIVRLKAFRKAMTKGRYADADLAQLPGRTERTTTTGTTKSKPGSELDPNTGTPVSRANYDESSNHPMTPGGENIPGHTKAAGYEYHHDLEGLMGSPAIRDAFKAASRENKLFEDVADKSGYGGRLKQTLTGEGAHRVKVELSSKVSKLMGDPKTSGDFAKIADARAAENKFVNWMDENVESYKIARARSAELRKPVTQAEVGAYLKDKFGPVLGEGTAENRYAPLVNAIKDEKGTIRSATKGKSSLDTFRDALTPKQTKVLDDLQADINLREKTENSASDASGYNPDFGGPSVKAPHLDWVSQAANFIVKHIGAAIDKNKAIEIAIAMHDPKLAASAIDRAVVHYAKGQKIASDLKKTGSVVNTARKIGNPLSNALATQQEKHNALTP